MRETFHRQLDALVLRVDEMAKLARFMLAEGVRSFGALDRDLAQKVLDRRDELARLDDEIEEQALKLVSLQQPMAGDLRSIAACLKLITYINRVGRYGKDIAQITLEWQHPTHFAKLVQIPFMTEIVLKMMDAVMKSFRERKTFDLKQFLEWEAALDATRWTVFRESLTYMAQNPANLEGGAHYMMIARYLERSGDNICKMAEKTHYMITGERLTIR